LETKKINSKFITSSTDLNTLKTKRVILASIIVVVLLYVLSYAWFRQTRSEVWEKDNNSYVIFPDDKVYLYYLYRPLSYVDGAVTGMKFHIGQHR
jgi:hypothetical protein